MDEYRNSTLGFCLLPCELIQSILLYLALPEIMHMKLVNKSIFCVISDRIFIHECNSMLKSTTWLFLYMKRWRRDSTLYGFSDRSNRWFKISVAEIMKDMITPGDDLYLLTASGNFFLFASNTQKVVISVNMVTKTVKRIPSCPIGPRGTSLWRRSGMKIVPDPTNSNHFRFLFGEFVNNRPVLFEYDSRTHTWQSKLVHEGTIEDEQTCVANDKSNNPVFLNLANEPYGNVMIAVGSRCHEKAILIRPRFNGVGNGRDRLHVYGDGFVVVVKFDRIDDVKKRVMGVELWGLSLNGGEWEYISKLPLDAWEHVYGVMIGCIEEQGGMIKMVLMSSLEGLWQIVWLSYDLRSGDWSWVRLPICKINGFNLGGITLSSGLTLT